MLLNYELHTAIETNHHVPVVLIHGLFGSLSNLGMIARGLKTDFDIVQIDLRNHGHSMHVNDMHYAAMAADILDTLDYLQIDQFNVIGHSMGGKVAMQLTTLAATRLKQLIVLDMAPFAYQENHHEQVFQALFAVKNAAATSRKEATAIMRHNLKEEMVIQFLLKSFEKGQWLFNVDALFQHYSDILAWQEITTWLHPTLFIRGENSPYIAQDQQRQAIDRQFKQAQIKTILGAGHWLHAEKTTEVNQLIHSFLTKTV